MQKRDHSKMLTIAPKVIVEYDEGKNELHFKRLNKNILGYIYAGINFLKLAKGGRNTKASSKQK